jgi:ABC-type amino acid transport substrate-binding protein
LLHIPADTFRFFPAVDNLVGARFGTLLAAMYTLVLALLGAGAVRGLLRIRWPKLGRWVVASLGLILLSLGGTRWFFEHVVGHEYTQYRAFVGMSLTREYGPATVTNSSMPPPPPHEPGRSRLQEIGRRGFLRVGYFKDALPFAFMNEQSNLVGFDIEMAHVLAREMGVRLELVLIDRAGAAAMLDAGTIDIVMSGMVMTLEHAADMTLSKPYMEQTLAFIVEDHRRDQFSSRDEVKHLKNLRIGVLNSPYYTAKLRQYLPDARLVPLDSPRAFFGPKGRDLDAMLYSAEAGSAWCLIYPAYAVAVPQPDLLRAPIAYGIARGDRELADYVDTWIELKKEDRTIETLYDHWILGQEFAVEHPRWSVIRDVLHWVD